MAARNLKKLATTTKAERPQRVVPHASFTRLRHSLACAFLTTTAVATPAFAQQDTDIAPPAREAVDDNGVDLSAAQMALDGPAISIGTSSEGLTYQRSLRGPGAKWSNPYQYATYGTPGSSIEAIAGDRSIDFTYDSATGLYTNKEGTGETLTGTGTSWTLTLRDGTIVQMDASDFDPNAGDYRYGPVGVLGVAHTIVFPNKEKLTLTYKQATDSSFSVSHLRLQSVLSSSGYMAKFEYGDNSTTYVSTAWNTLTKATLLNAATDYCAPSADTCTFSKIWPSLTFASTSSGISVTDQLSRTTSYTLSGGLLTGIRRPNSSTDDTIISYDPTHGQVSSVITDGRAWNYAWSLAGSIYTVTVTNPDATQKVYTVDTTIQQVKSEKDERNFTSSFTYDAQGRLTDILYPEGNKAHWDYDTRGNVLDRRLVSKTPGTPADIVMSAAYSSTCSSPVTCNEPTNTTDANGKVTDYTYDPTHGGVLTITRPAPTTGAIRPQTRYGYTSLQAYFKNSGGSIVASGQTTYMLTSVSECQTTLTCAGAADEVKSTITYGPQSAGSANNLLPISTSSGSGDGALTATKTLTYDDAGNVTYVDGPLAGDISRILYDAGRQVVGQIEPDPDGAGTLPNRAVRTTYNLDGQATKVERGTTAGQTDANWGAFSPAEVVDIGYDSSGREVTRKLSRSGTAYALTQSSYDANGRLQCSAVRMNTGAYGSLPTSACALGSPGIDGSDRISQVSYDAASEPTKFEQGAGTGDLRAERTLTYTNNGRVATLKDAGKNLTTYSYDGFDRLTKTQFPSQTQGAGTSSTTDYVQLGYDPNGNVTSRRLRDGTTVAFTYDNLNRATLKDLPGTEPDVSYVYDNLGRLTSTSQTGYSLSFTYDALGRNVTQTGPQGTVTSVYDLAGNRTLITYPGAGLSVNYDYLVTGDIQNIRENGATSGIGVLAAYGYDNLGNLSSVTYGNGVTQSYGYDPISRLKTLTTDLVGTANDLVIGGAATPITYNAATQITSAPRSNDAYSWTGAANVNRSYTSNGVNQYTAAGPASFTYDPKGNLTSDGTNSYAYSSENLLTSAPGTTLAYDPVTRLYQIAGSATTRFAYDGLNIIADYDGSDTLQHRYVFGPGIDQPLVEYAGSGTATRTFLSADERGSIIARTDNAGTLITANSYDEYGIPGSGNAGLFQYTGQAWLSQIGMSYYKARIYSPTLGRFLQTDPIGYQDGVNIYTYAHNDPVNLSDPLGLNEIVITGCRSCALEDAAKEARAVYADIQRQFDRLRDITRNFDRLRAPKPGKVKGVHVGRSCAGIAALQDPRVQQAALDALNQAKEGNVEFGLFVSSGWLGANSIGGSFNGGEPDRIGQSIIENNKPAGATLFIHTHQNYPAPQPITDPSDLNFPSAVGVPLAAIDLGGNITCAK